MPGRLHPSIELYWLCKNMKWAHLPVAGGLYDQHPRFIDDMMMLFQIDQKVQKAEHDKQQREAERKGRKRR